MAVTDVRWRDRTVVVAISGGADSTFLLHAACALRRRFGHDVVAAHVDHGWRGEQSREDARAVARLGADLGVPVHVMAVPTEQTAPRDGGIEASARAIRYGYLAEVARGCAAVAVLAAHTADDQAETIILSLLRGRSVAGLAAMAAVAQLPVPDAPGAVLVRPMLGIRADDVRATLRDHHVRWQEDSSNDDRARARNRVRHDLLPILEAISPGFRKALARAARDVEALRELLDCATGTAIARWDSVPDGWSARRVDWLSDAPVVRLAALREMLLRVGVRIDEIESAHLDAIARMIATNRGGARRTVDRAVVALIGDRLIVTGPGVG
jgi:tRNA(Ile)-lysidine synthase